MSNDPLVGYQTETLRFDRLIGKGAMGAVYKGMQLSLGRVVAIKVIAPHLADDPDHRLRFDREGRTLGRLVHPNIIACHDIGPCPGPNGMELFVMVLEFVDGWNLGTMMKRGKLTARRALDLHRQAAEGLAYAHAQGIIHRDLKPDNIMVTRTGVAKVADFGLAKAVDSTMLTQTGVVLGSPAYMSPEACQGQALTPASDLYGLGCSLFHCLTGDPPFPAASSLQVLNLHVTAPIPKVSSVRPDLAMTDKVVQRLMAKSPKDRHPHGMALAQELRELLPHVPGAVRAGAPLYQIDGVSATEMANPRPYSGIESPPSVPTGLAAGIRRRRWPWLIAALIVAALGLGLIVHGSRAPSKGSVDTAVKTPQTSAHNTKQITESFDQITALVKRGKADDLEAAMVKLDSIRELVPEANRDALVNLEDDINDGWQRLRDDLDRRLAHIRQALAEDRREEAKQALAELKVPKHFPDLVVKVKRLREQAERAVPRSTTSQPEVPPILLTELVTGTRRIAGDPGIPSGIPGGCGRIWFSATEGGGQRLVIKLDRSGLDDGDGIALVIHGRTSTTRSLRLLAGTAAGTTPIISLAVTGDDWEIRTARLKANPGADRLVIEADGDHAFAVAKLMLGRGRVPSEASLGVAAGTLRCGEWTNGDSGFREVLVQARRANSGSFPNLHRVALLETPDAAKEDQQAFLRAIDLGFDPESDDLTTDKRIISLHFWKDRPLRRDGDEPQVLVIPFRELTKTTATALPGEIMQKSLPILIRRGTLPVLVVQSTDGTSASVAQNNFRRMWSGIPIVNLDLVASFVRRNHLTMGADGRPTREQLDAGLKAGIRELAERMKWGFQEGGIDAEVQAKQRARWRDLKP